MGDVIHNLPVVTDLVRAFPGVRIDWVTEAPYAEVVKLHPGVSLALEVHLRWLKKSWWRDAPWLQLERDRQAMGEQDYDAILDTQGVVKSVMVAAGVAGQRNSNFRQSRRGHISSP